MQVLSESSVTQMAYHTIYGGDSGTGRGDTLIFNSSGSASEFLFKVNGSDKVIIDTSGNVGIGTTGPVSHLQINSADVANTIGLQRSLNTRNNIIKFATGAIDGAGDDWILGERNTTDSNFHLYSYGTSADAITVLEPPATSASGRQPPLLKLDVAGSGRFTRSDDFCVDR